MVHCLQHISTVWYHIVRHLGNETWTVEDATVELLRLRAPATSTEDRQSIIDAMLVSSCKVCNTRSSSTIVTDLQKRKAEDRSTTTFPNKPSKIRCVQNVEPASAGLTEPKTALISKEPFSATWMFRIIYWLGLLKILPDDESRNAPTHNISHTDGPVYSCAAATRTDRPYASSSFIAPSEEEDNEEPVTRPTPLKNCSLSPPAPGVERKTNEESEHEMAGGLNMLFNNQKTTWTPFFAQNSHCQRALAHVPTTHSVSHSANSRLAYNQSLKHPSPSFLSAINFVKLIF